MPETATWIADVLSELGFTCPTPVMPSAGVAGVISGMGEALGFIRSIV
jgi:metal-dependent amidase/aminoacylase/carboxypeptidase family protein